MPDEPPRPPGTAPPPGILSLPGTLPPPGSLPPQAASITTTAATRKRDPRMSGSSFFAPDIDTANALRVGVFGHGKALLNGRRLGQKAPRDPTPTHAVVACVACSIVGKRDTRRTGRARSR